MCQTGRPRPGSRHDFVDIGVGTRIRTQGFRVVSSPAWKGRVECVGPFNTPPLSTIEPCSYRAFNKRTHLTSPLNSSHSAFSQDEDDDYFRALLKLSSGGDIVFASVHRIALDNRAPLGTASS